MKRTAIFALCIAVTAGCQSSRARQRDFGQRPGGYPAPTPVPVTQGFPGAPPPTFSPGPPTGGYQQFPTMPPNGTGPAPSFPMAPPGGPGPGPATNPPPVPTTPGGNGPAPQNNPPGGVGKIESNWQPAESRPPKLFEDRVLLGPPEGIPDDDGKKTKKQLYPPQENVTPEPPTNPPNAAAPPVGIARFTQVAPKITAGLRPAFDDAFDWLQANKFRSVVYLRMPGDDDGDDHARAKQHGLKYHSLEVSPNLVTKETVDEFFKLVRAADRQPVFVYDRDGVLAGGMWYLWLRLVEEAPEDAARIRARTLGLRPERDGAHRDMWQAVQRYLNEAQGR